MKKKIVITGKKVHNVGYRPFLLAVAESLGIKRYFADNFFVDSKQGVYVLIDTDEEKVNAFVQHISQNFPEKAEVESITQEDYDGGVMGIASYYRYLTASQLSKIATYGRKMIERQDRTIEILNSVKEDTSAIRQDTAAIRQNTAAIKKDTAAIKKDTAAIRQDTSHLPSIKENTSSIKRNTESTPEMFSKILHEIDRIKKALIKAGIEI